VVGREVRTHNNLHARVAPAHNLDHLSVGVDDVVGAAAAEDVVGAEHEHDNVSRGAAQPALEVVVGNVDGQPARVALVVLIPVGGVGTAALRVAVLRTHILDLVGETGLGQLVPDEGAPAGDLRNAVTEGHWRRCQL
jgi:precorrin isomerase